MKVKFSNQTSQNLASPFDSIPPYDGSTALPQYVSMLTAELLHYHPSIKTEMVVRVNGDDIEIEVTMS